MAKGITFDDVYNYAISRKLTRNQALGLAQNVESESGFDPAVVNKIGATGLFQHLGPRKEKLLRFVQGDLSNWRKQIDFALMEPEARKFLATDFKDPYEATAHFTEKFERPENAKQKGKERADALAARLSGKKQPVQKATSPEAPVFDPGGVLAYDQMAGANAIRKSETPAFEPPAPDPSLPLPKVFQTDTPESYNYAGDPDELRKYVRSEGVEKAMAMTRDFEWSMNTVWGTSPDEAAKVKQIAKGSGIPEDMVRTDPAEWAKWDNARKTFDRVTARNSDGSLRYPAVVNWLRNPDNLEQAQDDIDWLAQVNEGIRKAKLLGESVGETALRDLNYGTTQVIGSMANLPGTVAKAMYEGVVAPNVNAAAKLAIRKEVLSSAAPKFLTKNPLTRFFESWADYYKAPDPDMASPFMRLAAGDAAAAMPLAYNTFRVAVQNIPQLVALAAGSSAKAAQSVGALAKVETLNFAYPLMFGMVFEDVYNRSRLEGKDPFSSLVSAIGQGTVEVGTEMMGTGKLIDGIIGGTAETGARGIAKGTVTQFIEEFMASAGSTGFEAITGSEVGLGEAAVQATTEGLVGGVTGASLTSVNTVRAFAARQAARSPEASAVMRQNAKLSEIVDQRAQHQQAFNDIRQGIQNSKTNLRNEDAAEDFISESLRENKQDEYLYVDAEALFTAFQERMPPEQEEEIWQYFGLDKETIDHARKVEGEVPIKKATATQAEIKFGLEGIWDELAPMTKYFADDVTDPEIEAEMRNLAEMNKALRQKLDEIKEQTVLPESMKQIRKTLIESRTMNAEEADANMLVAMAGLNVLAKHFGVDLETYANETLGLTVELNPGTERQGMVEMFGGGTKITLYKGAKRDTFLHEMAHVFEAEIRKLSQNGVKNPEFAAQAGRILESTKNDPEGFVKLFTAYLSEGKAPAVAMDEAFSLFRKWVQQIYRAVDTGLGVQLDDDARGFFDALLASESDIEQAKLFYEQVEAFQEYFVDARKQGKETPAPATPSGFEKSKVKETVYHGSSEANIESFWTEQDQTGGSTHATNTSLGAYFSEDPDIAVAASGGFSTLAAFSRVMNDKELTVYHVKLNMTNPLNLDNLSEQEKEKIEAAFPGFRKVYEKNAEDPMPVLAFFARAREVKQNPGNFASFARDKGIAEQSEIDRIFKTDRENEVYKRWKAESDEFLGSLSRSVGKERLKALGYDGIVLTTEADSGELKGPKKQYVVFDSGNAKIIGHQSATDLVENGVATFTAPFEEKQKAEKTALQIQTEKRLAAYYRAIGGKAEVRNNVTKKVEDMEVYSAMAYARNTGGLREMDLLALGVSKEIVASIRSKHPGLFNKAKNESNAKKYTSVVSMAAESGYGSVEEMVAELANALPKQEMIQQEYEKEQARIQNEIVRSVLKSDTGATNADEAMHNEDYGAALIAETQEIAEKLERGQKAAVQRVEKQAMEAWAKRQARALPVSMATRAKPHLRKESSYAKKAVEAMKQGNFSVAYDAMMGRLREHFAAKEAIDLLRWSERFANRYTASRVTERLRPKGKRGVVNEYEQIIFALMSEYRVGARIDKEGNVVFSEKIAPKKSWADVRTQIDPTILEYFPDWVIRGEKPDGFRTWRDLTVEQAKDLEAALGQLEAFGSDLLKSEIFGEMKTVQEALDAAKESMSHLRRKKTFNRNTLLGQIQAKIDRSFIPWLAKFEVLFERLDNYSVLKGMTFGVHRRIFNGAIAAEAIRHELVTSTVKNAGTAHEVLAKAQKRLDAQFGTRISAGKNPLTSLLKPELAIPNLPFPQILAKAYGQNGWTSHQLVGLLMNAGNNSNWQVTKDGYGFPDGTRDTLFSLFTKEELQAAQQLGDATGSLYEHTNETYKKLSHRDLTKVEAEGITAVTNIGERVELRGWYHPLKYDRKLTGDTFKEEDFLKQEMDAVLYRITPDSGFTKIRKSNVSLAPLLDMKVWYDHIDRAAIFASSAVLLRDAARIFGNKAWQSELTEVLGADGAEETKRKLIQWMADLARPYSPKMQDNFVSKALYKAHRRGVAVTLFLNIPVAATQRLGIVNALSALGQDGKGAVRYYLEACKEVPLRDHILGEKKSELWNRLLSISPQLRIREDHMNQLIRDAKLEMKGDDKSISFFGRNVTMGEIREFGFELLRMQDRALIMPVYLAAMKKYLDNHLEGDFNERQAGAVAYADSLVRAHQPASSVAEMTAFERDGGWIRIFMAFMSFSSTLGGRMQQTFEAWRDGALPTKKMAQFVFLEIVLASEIYNLLQYALRFDWPEDLWEFLGDAVRAPLDMLLSPIPIARDIPRAIAKGGSGRSLLGNAPAGKALDQGAINPLVSTKNLLQGEQDFGVWLYDMAKAVEIYYGIPAFTFVENTIKTYNNAKEKIGK